MQQTVEIREWAEARARRKAAEARRSPEAQAERSRRRQVAFAVAAGLYPVVAFVAALAWEALSR